MLIKQLFKYLIVSILVGIFLSEGYPQNGNIKNYDKKAQARQIYAERDEIRQTYRLAPGSNVELSVIAGPVVEIETSDTNLAEVFITRSARNREDLNYRKIDIQQSANSLVIRGVNDWNRDSRVRQEVRLKLPRRITLSVKDISAPIKIGEIEGAMHLDNISGPATVDQSAGCLNASQISGPLTATVADLASCGVNINQVSGPVNLSFKGLLNADFSISGFKGQVGFNSAASASILQKTDSLVKARTGNGGVDVVISGISGGVYISSR